MLPDRYNLSLWLIGTLVCIVIIMFGKLLFIIGLASAGLLLLVLNLTTPSTAGAGGVLVVFFLGYIVTLAIVTFSLWGTTRVLLRFAGTSRVLRNVKQLSLTRSYYYATVISFAPVLLVSLQSVGGVGIYEVGLVVLFVILGCIYIARRLR